MEYLKKFESINEFLESEEFKKKDLSYLDLSNLDLSKLEPEIWKEFLFDHTNFSNTNIHFAPRLLKGIDGKFSGKKVFLEYCDFTDCDLSYLSTWDMECASITGSNFTNTNLNIEFLDSYGYQDVFNGFGIRDYSDVIFPCNLDSEKSINKIIHLGNLETIKNNSWIHFTSSSLFHFIKVKLPYRYISEERKKYFNRFIDQVLEIDQEHEGKILEFYNLIKDNCATSFTDMDRLHFFQGIVSNKEFDKVDFSSIPIALTEKVLFSKCSFSEIILPPYYEKYIDDRNGGFNMRNSFTSIVKSETIQPSSWNQFKEKRLFGHVTFYRNLYLELGRFCNGNCIFCRNKFLPPCKYDLENIKSNLKKISHYLNTIVVGGGEPTLNDDVLQLLEVLHDNYYTDKVLFTNASLPLERLLLLSRRFDGVNISRHSVSDQENNEILGVSALRITDLKELERQVGRANITLCATCFKGKGIDSVRKMEDYIMMAEDCDINHVLFQTLHKDLESDFPISALPIEDEIFDEMIALLQEQGYKISLPIYSTGDYKLYIAQYGKTKISFKKYISKEELEKEWYQAPKRTVDLSMDPSGNLYQNWHQSSDKVLLKN